MQEDVPDTIDRHASSAARLLRAMANESRLSILCRLGRGEMSVGALAEAVGLSPSALSQHLAKLRAEGLVRTRRSAQTVFYGLASREAAMVITTLAELYCPAPQPHDTQPQEKRSASE